VLPNTLNVPTIKGRQGSHNVSRGSDEHPSQLDIEKQLAKIEKQQAKQGGASQPD
jgi:hypothetical protein